MMFISLVPIDDKTFSVFVIKKENENITMQINGAGPSWLNELCKKLKFSVHTTNNSYTAKDIVTQIATSSSDVFKNKYSSIFGRPEFGPPP